MSRLGPLSDASLANQATEIARRKKIRAGLLTTVARGEDMKLYLDKVSFLLTHSAPAQAPVLHHLNQSSDSPRLHLDIFLPTYLVLPAVWGLCHSVFDFAVLSLLGYGNFSRAASFGIYRNRLYNSSLISTFCLPRIGPASIEMSGTVRYCDPVHRYISSISPQCRYDSISSIPFILVVSCCLFRQYTMCVLLRMLTMLQ